MKTNQSFFPAFQIYVDSTSPNPLVLKCPVAIPNDYIMYASVVEGTFVPPTNSTGGVVGNTLKFYVIPSSLHGSGQYYENEAAISQAQVISRTIPTGSYSNFEIAEFFSFTEVDPFDAEHFINVQTEFIPQQNRFIMFFSTTTYTTPPPLLQAAPFQFIRLCPTQLSSSLGFTASFDSSGVYPIDANGLIYSGDPYYLIPLRQRITGTTQPTTTTENTINNIYVNTNLTSRVGDNVLAKVLVDVDPGMIVHFYNRNDFAVQVYDKAITNLEYWLTDNTGNRLDISFSMTLQFDVCSPPEKPYVPSKPTEEITGRDHIQYVLAQDPIPVFIVPIPSEDADHPDAQVISEDKIPDSGTAPALRLPQDDNSFV